MNYYPRVLLTEEGMRDGLQIERPDIPVADKIRLLDDLSETGLKEIAVGRDMTLSDLVAEIDSHRHGNLSSAIRLFVIGQYRDRLVVYRDQVADHQGGPAQEQLVA